MTTQTQTTSRFRLKVAEHSNDTWGWNGRLIDTQTRLSHPLIKTFVDYVLDGEVGYGTCAFDTKAEMVAAAKRKAWKLQQGKAA